MSLRRALPLLVALASLLLASPAALAQPLVVLDPGHGGTDPGAVAASCDVREAPIVLDVGLRLRTALEAAGLRVAMTRETDDFIALSARAAFANSRGANVFVSVHSNSNGGTPATGTETWISNGAGASTLRLATLLQAEMVSAWGLRDRGVKREDFTVLYATTMPAALAELAFTNNCALDATYLSSPTHRQSMAEAQARAILDWLGIEPSGDGILRGVVFEDQGVGTDDMSVRLEGATLRVSPSDRAGVAEGADASWSFTLPVGSYTVEASAAGHLRASRTCDVVAGATTWCSIGLFPSAEPDPDASIASTPDASVAAAPDAALAPADAAPSPDAARTGGDASGATARPVSSDCACRVAAPRSGGGSTALLSLLAVCASIALRKRRPLRARGGARIAALAAIAAIGSLVGCASGDAAAREALGRTSTSDDHARGPTSEAAARPSVGPRLPILEERELVLVGADHEALGHPILAPDARHVLVAPTGFGALYAVDLTDPSRLTPLCASPYCGFEPRFFGEGRVATRTPEQTASAIPGDAYTLEGLASDARLGSGGAMARVEGEDTVLVQLDGATRTLRAGDDRFILAELAPDHRHVVVWGLARGLSIHRLADGARFELGPGTGHPHFDPSGRVLVFDRTSDDGHLLTSGDVYAAELGATIVVRSVLATDRIETSPSISRVDERGEASIAAERDGALVIVRVRFERGSLSD